MCVDLMLSYDDLSTISRLKLIKFNNTIKVKVAVWRLAVHHKRYMKLGRTDVGRYKSKS